jgi:DNA-binding NtrC family response regulator
VILLTAQGSVEAAVAAMRAGAFDFTEKPIDAQRLGILLGQALARRRDRQEVARLKDDLKSMGRFGHMVGQSDAMQTLYQFIDQVADTEATVLVTGESGTGKELIARTVHDMSSRANGPFVAVNCSAIMATLWESEIFGFEKGSFTGADKRHLGYMEQAQGGTLFLDEIGEMSTDTQAKFLRVLENRKLKRVGGTHEIDLDIRVVAATNRDLEESIANGTFREDLYYRLNVFTLHAPPLAARRSDIPLLAQTFIRNFAESYGKHGLVLDDEATARLRAYHWPGNVRELRNAMERAVILAADGVVGLRHLPPKVSGAGMAPTQALESLDGLTVAEMEQRLIMQTLEKSGGNKTQAAKALGISLKTLHNKLGRYRQEAQEITHGEG